jgi:endoglucanase
MVPVTGIPFPYSAEEMPAVPAEVAGTWIGSSYSGYSFEGTEARVKQLLNTAIRFRNTREVPLFCGEFGVYIPNSNNEDRVYWYGVVRKYLEENNIAWTIWDYTGGFGLFEKGSDEQFEYDLNVPLVDTLGFTVPGQSEYIQHPDTIGFKIYQDYIMENIYESGWQASGILDFYHNSGAYAGDYCIYWTGAEQYNQIGFNFKPDKDLSVLVDEDYAINFWVKGNTPGARFDIRFLDTKTADPEDHPWRMGRTITQSVALWDGAWHHVYIPLWTFIDQGSWDNSWFNPIGAFDWTAVDRFEIVAEHSNMTAIDFWFDNIEISDRNTYIGANVIFNNLSLTVAPNPFRDHAMIGFNIPSTSNVDISIYNIAGQRVITLSNQIYTSGEYSVSWDGEGADGNMIADGFYFCRMEALGHSIVRKLVLLK